MSAPEPSVPATGRNLACNSMADPVIKKARSNPMDAAMEKGRKAALAGKGDREIWLPWRGFNGHADTGFYPTEEHIDTASQIHPAWASLKDGPRALHSRNVGQVLGADLRTPVSFVLAYTADGCETEATRTKDTGGTATAIVLADIMRIPVFNLANPDARDRFVSHVRFVLQDL